MSARESAIFSTPSAKPRSAHLAARPGALANAVNIRDVAPSPHRYLAGAREAGLTPIQLAVAKCLGQGLSVGQAIQKVGCHKESGYSAAKNPKVQAYAREEMKRNEGAVEMSRGRVMDGYLEAIEMAKMQADPLTMVRGWTEVAKMCGYFAPDVKKIEISLSAKRLVDKMEQMSDDELLKFADPSIIEGIFTEIPDEGDENAQMARETAGIAANPHNSDLDGLNNGGNDGFDPENPSESAENNAFQDDGQEEDQEVEDTQVGELAELGEPR
jgi:hypothetical protein